MFLEAGVGFWEVWDEPDAFCDYEELRLIDFADRWGLAGRTILAAECIGGTWDDSVLSRFMIVMDCGTLTLSSRDSANIESGAVLAFQPTAKIGK